MYVYRIVEDTINEECEEGFETEFSYITHENKYSQEDFSAICKKAYDLVNGTVYSFKLIRVMCEKFGFKAIEPIATFQYEIE